MADFQHAHGAYLLHGLHDMQLSMGMPPVSPITRILRKRHKGKVGAPGDYVRFEDHETPDMKRPYTLRVNGLRVHPPA